MMPQLLLLRSLWPSSSVLSSSYLDSVHPLSTVGGFTSAGNLLLPVIFDVKLVVIGQLFSLV